MAARRGVPVEVLRRVDGRDVVFTGRPGCYWVELDEGYRVFFQRRRGPWIVTRAGSAAVLTEARTLTEAYRLVRRHYLALRRLAG